jgi:hypothetical protein
MIPDTATQGEASLGQRCIAHGSFRVGSANSVAGRSRRSDARRHISPWIGGGLTVLTNLQALCGSCNLQKGSRPQQIIEQFFDVAKCAPEIAPLRRWQSEAMQVALPALQKEPVLVEACPGAGKTTFGLTVAYRLLESRAISRVLIVAPTLGIVDGWLLRRARGAAAPRSIGPERTQQMPNSRHLSEMFR